MFEVLSKVFRIYLVLLCLQIVYAGEEQNKACIVGQFKCSNGQCISANRTCDLFKDCDDGSDETFAECHDFQCDNDDDRCAYGACIAQSKFCNGQKDCWDGKDENEYRCSDDIFYDVKLRGNCSNVDYTKFQCEESLECISFSKLCDGVEDCRDKSDEAFNICVSFFCPAWSFQCEYGACIAKDAACNHYIDCRDGSDEIPSVCNKKMYLPEEADWNLPSWQYDLSDTTPSIAPISITTPPPMVKNCQVTNTALHLRPMYTKVPFLSDGFVSHTMTVQLRCNTSYVLLGSDVNTCNNGSWEAPLPECVKLCKSGGITADSRFKAVCSYKNNAIDCAKDPLMVSTIATISCAQGYYTDEPRAKAEHVCTERGTWARQNKFRLNCKPDCGRKFVTVKEDPWLVSVFERMPFDTYEFRCLGTIIDQFHVLSVVNCFADSHKLPTSYSIVLGNQSIGFNLHLEHGYNIRNIANIEVNDLKPLALLRLINPLVLSANVRPICLQNSTEENTTTNMETLGKPFVAFKNNTGKYFLTHIADYNRNIDIGALFNNLTEQVKQYRTK